MPELGHGPVNRYLPPRNAPEIQAQESENTPPQNQDQLFSAFDSTSSLVTVALDIDPAGVRALRALSAPDSTLLVLGEARRRDR